MVRTASSQNLRLSGFTPTILAMSFMPIYRSTSALTSHMFSFFFLSHRNICLARTAVACSPSNLIRSCISSFLWLASWRIVLNEMPWDVSHFSVLSMSDIACAPPDESIWAGDELSCTDGEEAGALSAPPPALEKYVLPLASTRNLPLEFGWCF